MKADGIIHPKEEEFINVAYKNLGITIKDLEDVSTIDDYEINLIVSDMSVENKNKAHSLCIGMAEADGFVHPKELEIINNLFS